MTVTQNILLDVSRENSAVVCAVQGDVNSRFLRVSVFSGGAAVSVGSGVTVCVNAKRGYDGASSSFAGSVNTDGTVTVPVSQWMTEYPGEVSCSVQLSETGGKISTMSFLLTVYPENAAGTRIVVYYVNAALTAGPYYITIGGVSYAFTLTAQAPAGGIIRFNAAMTTAYIYNTQDDASPTQTLSLTQTATGTRLVPTDEASIINSLIAGLATAAKQDGTYDTLTAGRAKHLVAACKIKDTAPYLFRTTAGEADAGAQAEDTLVGGTVAFNQIVSDANKSGSNTLTDTRTYIELRVRMGVSPYTVFYNKTGITSACCVRELFTCTADAPSFQLIHNGSAHNILLLAEQKKLVKGHRYFLSVTLTSVDVTTVGGMTWDNAMVIDLTKMFGAAVADTMTVERFTALFPKAYYACNAGELMSVRALSHVTLGLNQWDGTCSAVGKYLDADGSEHDADGFCISSYIRVAAGKMYNFLNTPVSSASSYCWYNADKNYLSGSAYTGPDNPRQATAPSDAAYLRVSVLTAAENVCISLYWSGYRSTEEAIYNKNTYALDSALILRGVMKYDDTGNLYYDGDRYAPDGTVTRKYKSVSLNTLTWTYESAYQLFRAVLSDAYRPFAAALSDRYYVSNARYNNLADGEMSVCDTSFSSQNVVLVKDTAYTDVASFTENLGTATLVYALADETTETAAAFTSPQTVDDFGTEAYVVTEQSGVAVPVGHETLYEINLRDRVQRLPAVPCATGDYAVHYDASTGKFTLVQS